MDTNIDINNYLTFIAASGLIIIMLLIIKKLIIKNRNNQNSGIELKIINRINLHSKANLFLVNVSGKTLLIGVSDNHISTLADLTDALPPQTPTKAKDSVIPVENPTQNNEKKTDPLSFKNFILSELKREKKN